MTTTTTTFSGGTTVAGTASPPLAPYTPPAVGIFSPAELNRHIKGAFDNVPVAHNLVMFAYAGLNGDLRATVAMRLTPGGHWSMGATFARDAATGAISGGAQVQWSGRR